MRFRQPASLLARGVAVAVAAAVLLLAGAACRGGDDDELRVEGDVRGAEVPCVDEDPGAAAAYANDAVGIGRNPDEPPGAALESHRSNGPLPWFAKTAL